MKRNILFIIMLLIASTFVSANDKYTQGKCLVTTDRLKIRESSDLKSNVLSVLDTDTIVVFLEEGKSEKIDGILDNWVKVKALPKDNWQTNDNWKTWERTRTLEGWVFGGYLAETPIVREIVYQGETFSVVQYYNSSIIAEDYRSRIPTRLFLVNENQSEVFFSEEDYPWSKDRNLFVRKDFLDADKDIIYKDFDHDGVEDAIFCMYPQLNTVYILKSNGKEYSIAWSGSFPDPGYYEDMPSYFLNIKLDFESNPATISFDCYSPYRYGYQYEKYVCTWSDLDKKFVKSTEYYAVQNEDLTQLKKLTQSQVDYYNSMH